MGDRDLRVRLKNPGARNEYLEVLNSHLRNEYLQVLIRRFLYLGWRCNASWQTGPNSTTGFPATRGREILYRPPGHQKGSFEAGRELCGGLSVPW